MLNPNDHVPTKESRQRVTDLVRAGTPKYIITRIIGIDQETLNKYYDYEMTCAKSEAIVAIGTTVFQQALNGNEKSQSLYLKTQGASQGWVEKQVIENVDNTQTVELMDKVKQLESKYNKEF